MLQRIRWLLLVRIGSFQLKTFFDKPPSCLNSEKIIKENVTQFYLRDVGNKYFCKLQFMFFPFYTFDF